VYSIIEKFRRKNPPKRVDKYLCLNKRFCYLLMTEKIYHIYDEETCIAPCVSEETFHKHWEEKIKDNPDKLDYEELDNEVDKELTEGSY